MSNTKLFNYAGYLFNLSPADDSREFQIDLLYGLEMKVDAAMERCAGVHKVDFATDSHITFSANGLPTWRKVVLFVNNDREYSSEEHYFQFNSAGSFKVDGSKHPLESHPLIAAAYQVCEERRNGDILDSELITIYRNALEHILNIS
jgi:hypothetical protein